MRLCLGSSTVIAPPKSSRVASSMMIAEASEGSAVAVSAAHNNHTLYLFNSLPGFSTSSKAKVSTLR